MRFIVFSIGILLAVAGPAFAQVRGTLPEANPAYAIPGPAQQVDTRATDDNFDPLKNPIFRALSSGMQDQLLSEAQAYHGQCLGRVVYAAMHDCNCLSIHYLNERLRHPDQEQGAVAQTIIADCVDQPSIAGYSYDRCVSIYSSSYPDIIKPLCECYAKRFARAFAKAPNDNSDYMTALGVRAVAECKTYLQSFAPALTAPPH